MLVTKRVPCFLSGNYLEGRDFYFDLRIAVAAGIDYLLARNQDLDRTRPAADEVNDFEAVTFAQFGGGPTIARNDVAIEFDRNAVGFHAKIFNESCQRERLDGLAEHTLFTVDLQLH